MTAFPQWLLHSVVMCHVHNTWHKVNTHQMTGNAGGGNPETQIPVPSWLLLRGSLDGSEFSLPHL